MNSRKRILAERRRLRLHYGPLFEEVRHVLCEDDPIGLHHMGHPRAYEIEVGTILPRLHLCRSVADARKVIHQEFVRWFSPSYVGEECDFQDAGEWVWSIWQRYRPEPPPDFGLSPPFMTRR